MGPAFLGSRRSHGQVATSKKKAYHHPMAVWKTATDYDEQAGDFEEMRRPGPEVVAYLARLFTPVSEHVEILSIGCGTGQYEEAVFEGRGVVGLDQSEGMLHVAQSRLSRVVKGNMVSLPFEDASFSGAYFVQSLHHVGANAMASAHDRTAMRTKAIAEAVRVVAEGPIAVVQRDPSQNAAVWFWHYFPEALKVKLEIQPSIATVSEWFEQCGLISIDATPLDDPMITGFYEPTSPKNASFRRAFSEFSYLTVEQLEKGLNALKSDIDSGKVYERIDSCRKRFADIGGTVYGIAGFRPKRVRP